MDLYIINRKMLSSPRVGYKQNITMNLHNKYNTGRHTMATTTNKFTKLNI